MAQDSKIEWTKHTANLWHGCTKVHAGCDNCYAETLSHRWGNDVWGNDKPRKEVKSVWADLDKFEKMAAVAGEVHTVFVGSMMDIFEKPMPLIDSKGEKLDYTTGELRHKFFTGIDAGRWPHLIFLLLTKRPSNINKMIPWDWKDSPPWNVWFGTSPVDQETANTLVNQLLNVNGSKFLSIEPQIGPIKIDVFWLIGNHNHTGVINWIIQGGESGHHKRPFDLQWARDMRDFLKRYVGTPYFFKQIDKVQAIPEDLQVRQIPNYFNSKI